MLDRDVAVRIDQRVLDATTMRAEGMPLKVVAHHLGIAHPRQLIYTLRSAYEEVLGVNNSVAAAHHLDKLGFLDLTAIGIKHTPPLSRLGRADRILVVNFITEPPAHLQGDSLKYAEKDYQKTGPESLVKRLGASNMTHLLAIGRGLESVGRLSEVEPTDIPEDQIATILKIPEVVKPKPLTPVAPQVEQPKSSDKLIGTVLTQRQGGIFKLAATGDDRTMTMRKLGIGNRETYRQQLSSALEAAGLKNGKGLNSKDASEVVLTSRFELTRRLMATGEIDPLEIAKSDFKTAELLVRAFGKLTPFEAQIVKLLDQGKSPAQIATDLSQSDQKKLNPPFIRRMISFIYEKVPAKTLFHLFVLSEANNRLRAKGLSA